VRGVYLVGGIPPLWVVDEEIHPKWLDHQGLSEGAPGLGCGALLLAGEGHFFGDSRLRARIYISIIKTFPLGT